MESKIMTHGICKHCGKNSATRLPLKLCPECSDELFNLPVGSKERRIWWQNNLN